MVVTVWVVAGMFLLLRGVPGIVALWRSRSWLETEGTAVGSRAAGGYSYRLGSDEYVGHRRTFDPGAGTHLPPSGGAKGDTGTGRALWVWYDPRNPHDSVLRRSASTSLLLVALGMTSLILATHTLISGASP